MCIRDRSITININDFLLSGFFLFLVYKKNCFVESSFQISIKFICMRNLCRSLRPWREPLCYECECTLFLKKKMRNNIRSCPFWYLSTGCTLLHTFCMKVIEQRKWLRVIWICSKWVLFMTMMSRLSGNTSHHCNSFETV